MNAAMLHWFHCLANISYDVLVAQIENERNFNSNPIEIYIKINEKKESFELMPTKMSRKFCNSTNHFIYSIKHIPMH